MCWLEKSSPQHSQYTNRSGCLDYGHGLWALRHPASKRLKTPCVCAASQVMKLYLPKLKSFIDSICGVTDKVEVLPMGITANKEAVLIDGEVFVRSVYNDFHVMKKSWKKRYLQLSLQSLTVSKPTDKHEMEDRIHAQHLHVVEMAEASGLDRKFVILIQLGRDEVVLIALPNQKVCHRGVPK